MENAIHTRLSYLFVLGLVGALAAPGVCFAEEAMEEPVEWSRQGNSELYFVVQSIGSDTVSYGGGLDEVKGTTAFGAGIGLDATDHFNVNMEFLLGSTADIWTIPGLGSAERDASIWFLNLNLDYNILKSRLTPFVSGGIGVMGMKGQTFNGYDYTDATFSYNLGVGGRWDITDHLSLRVLYRITWAQFDGADSANEFKGLMATIAYMFR